MNARRVSRPDNRTEIVGIFDAVKDDDQRRLGSAPGGVQHVTGLGIGLGGDERDDPLMPGARHHPIQGVTRLDMDRHPQPPCQINDV